MQTLRVVMLILFVIDSVLLVIAILLQSGRGGGLAGALGGISSADSALGVRAISQIEKATGILAAIFLALALGMAFVEMHKSRVPSDVKIGTRPATGITLPGEATSEPAVGATASPAKATTEGGAAVPATTPAETTTPARAEGPGKAPATAPPATVTEPAEKAGE